MFQIYTSYLLGLFSGAVMLSGNPLNQWALARDAASFVKGLAQQLGVNTSSSINILEGLKTIPQDTLQKNYHTLFQRVCIRLCNKFLSRY